MYYLGACDNVAFPNNHCLLVILRTIPFTNAEAECVFSLVRWLRTYLRSTVVLEGLSDLSIIATHYGERIAVVEVCKPLYRLNQDDCSNLHCLRINFTQIFVIMQSF